MYPKPDPTPLYPVLLSVPSGPYRRLPVRERVRFLSRTARQALRLSAEKSGVSASLSHLFPDDPDALPKAENGAPLPVNGVHWSLTHKPGWGGGVAGPRPVGIDLEQIRPYSDGLREKIAGPDEWELIDPAPLDSFFRYWTAKEAVLKAAGTGLTELSRCRIAAVPDRYRISVRYRQHTWTVAQHYFEGHVAAIVSDYFTINWTVIHATDPDDSE